MIPASFDDEQQRYLTQEFNDITRRINSVMTLPKNYAMPTKPVSGRIYYFPATIAPTITSVGFWGYNESTWVHLG